MSQASTRDRLIRAAHDLFYRDGFHAVGLDRILADVGVTKTTFYNHFESKDDLVVAALRWHDQWWQNEFVALLRRHGGDSAKGQLLAIGGMLRDVFAMEEGSNGCIFVNAAVQYPIPHDPPHEAAATHKKAMEEVLRQVAAYAGAGDARALAQELSLVLEGAYVSFQVTRRPEVAETASRAARAIIERHIGG